MADWLKMRIIITFFATFQQYSAIAASHEFNSKVRQNSMTQTTIALCSCFTQ